MTESKILSIAKKTSCNCANCNSRVYSSVGKPVFGNDAFDCRIDTEGNTYCSSCAGKLSRNGEITLVNIPEWTEKDRVSDREEILNTLHYMTMNEKFLAYEKDEHITVRCKKEDTSIFVYAHGRSRYGYRYSFTSFADRYDLKAEKKTTKKTPTEEWHGRISRAIKCLEKSGLWADLLVQLRNMLTMTYEDREYIRLNCAWNEESTDLINRYEKKYPFLFYTAENGKKYVNSAYIYEMSEITLKPMYFGKYANKKVKEEIAENIANKTEYKYSCRVSYDVSFSYDPKIGKAYYSEEYRDCGNGHYYLALDNNTALFCEDD
jgi:hypothetical protein